MGCNAADGACGCASGCKGACKSPKNPNPACVIGNLPCPAESHSRACLPGDPALSTTVICRRAIAQGRWDRTFSTATIAAGDYTTMVVIFPAFVASGKLCITSLALTITTDDEPPVVTAVPLTSVGGSAVWDFADSPGAPLWTARVAEPCMHGVGDISTTTGRCPCDAACADCLYPAALGGLFAVKITFPLTTFPALATVRLDVSGTFVAQPPCCEIPLAAGEPPVVGGAYPALQSIAA